MIPYEIDQRILSMTDPETGEILDDSAFDALMMERNAICENMALWYKDLVAESEVFKKEIATLMERKQKAEQKAARIKDYLERALNGEKMSTARVKIGYRNVASLSVMDEAAAATWLEESGHIDLVTRQTHLDKRGITSLIKCGSAIPGVELVEKTTMQVR